MSGDGCLTCSWKVGSFTCTLTMAEPENGQLGDAFIEWEPHVPERLDEREIAEYVAGRNAALAEVSQLLGLRALVIVA